LANKFLKMLWKWTGTFQRMAGGALIVAATASCVLLGPEKSVEIVGKTDHLERLNLTPRHYKSKEHCRRALELLPPSLTGTLSPLSADERARLQWPALLAGFKSKQCESFKKRGEILATFVDILAEKTRRIGIILPPVSASEPAIQIILDQIRKELTQAGFQPDSTLIIKRAEKTRESAFRAAAELTHMDRVAILIGGIHPAHAAAIVQMSDQAQIPSLIVSANAPLGRTIQSMRVYPPVKKLATRLVDTLKSRDVRQAVVFYPQGANLELYQLMRLKAGAGISYAEATYNPDDPQGLLNAVRGQIGKVASASGTPAVIILDNFRMVRHIINIVSTSIPGRGVIFAGNQQWRSPALVNPKDEAMQGAMFVDFIGKYRNLPDQIETPISDNDYFTTAQAASRIDYQIIGHRLANLAVEASRYGLARHQIAARLISTRNKWDYYFPNDELAFDDQRDSSWPVFLFQVSDNSIGEIK
jgi:hypothetical protein